MHLLIHVLGIDNTAGYWYGFWSGFGSDLGELAIVGGLISIYHRHTCHVARCHRIGRMQVQDTPWVVCRKHHPAGAPNVHDLKA